MNTCILYSEDETVCRRLLCGLYPPGPQELQPFSSLPPVSASSTVHQDPEPLLPLPSHFPLPLPSSPLLPFSLPPPPSARGQSKPSVHDIVYVHVKRLHKHIHNCSSGADVMLKLYVLQEIPMHKYRVLLYTLPLEGNPSSLPLMLSSFFLLPLPPPSLEGETLAAHPCYQLLQI